MAEIGKIEKPEAATFSAKRKLYLVPVFPSEISSKYDIDMAKVERFWGEVRERINYFISTYGRISVIFIEGMNEDDMEGLEHFETIGKEKNQYKLIKSLIESGAVLKGIETASHIEHSKLLLDEYSKSFRPEIEELHKDYYGRDINFNGWRDLIIEKIKEINANMSVSVTRIIGEFNAGSSAMLIISDGRAVEFPRGVDVFQIRPPAFDELEREIREKIKKSTNY